MTQEFQTVHVDSIIIDRTNRQRKEVQGVEELAASINRLGLLQPIIITKDNILVAGECRLTAVKSLGWSEIQVNYLETLDPVELHLIELEENVRRTDLTWQERVAATAAFHKLSADNDANWTKADTARTLNMSATNVSDYINVATAVAADPEAELAKLPNLSTAVNRITRIRERAKKTVLDDISFKPTSAVEPSKQETKTPLPTELHKPIRKVSLINNTFQNFGDSYTGPKFNFIHCDFPYGVNAGDKIGQSSAKELDGYVDTPEIYFELLNYLLTDFDKHIDEQAHCMFWFSMDYYEITRKAFEAAGWVVNPFPLIWGKSDNRGILPDANRGPRRIYETALLCTRGDRKVVKAVGNFVGAATTKEYHMSEKPAAMLEHFFRMLVDESTYMIDPTCGSGMALKVAEAEGARGVVGIEKSADFLSRAETNLNL